MSGSGYQLVGTFQRGADLDALVRLPGGLVVRLGAGAVFDAGKARILELRADRVRIEVNTEITTLHFAARAEQEADQEPEKEATP